MPSTERTDRVPGPLLAVYGTENDPITPPQTADTFTAVQPDAPLVRVDRASHFVHVDRPDAFIDAVTGFLGVTTPEGHRT
ncbi:alpha/beta fold hydrolase [Nocardia takedensis]|uniref:alpha/beta fold hydrolase n=1 Tax=Nocardia takedensis TaxID=259390 RepID=UPI003F75EF3D